jgi:hypothetical protein
MNDTNEFRTVLESVLTVFIVFKLTGVIDWSWVYVLMPFWIPLVMVIPIILWKLIVNYGKGRKTWII